MVSGFLCFYHSWWALSGCVYSHANKPQLETNLVRLKEIKLWDKGYFIKNYKCSHSPGVKPDCPRKHVYGFVWCNLNSGLGLCTLETLSEDGGEAGGPHQLKGAGQLSHWAAITKDFFIKWRQVWEGKYFIFGGRNRSKSMVSFYSHTCTNSALKCMCEGVHIQVWSDTLHLESIFRNICSRGHDSYQNQGQRGYMIGHSG